MERQNPGGEIKWIKFYDLWRRKDGSFRGFGGVPFPHSKAVSSKEVGAVTKVEKEAS